MSTPVEFDDLTITFSTPAHDPVVLRLDKSIVANAFDQLGLTHNAEDAIDFAYENERLRRRIAALEKRIADSTPDELLVIELRSEVAKWRGRYEELRAEHAVTPCESCDVCAERDSLRERLTHAVRDVVRLAGRVDELEGRG